MIIARSLHAHPASTGLKGERPFLVPTKKQRLYIKNQLPTELATWSLFWMWVLSKFQELKTKTAMPATARAQLSCASATHPALISHHKPLFLISPSRALHGNAQGASEMKRLAPWRVAAHQTGPQECEPEGGGGGTGCRVIAVPNQAPSQLDETAAPSYQSTGT